MTIVTILKRTTAVAALVALPMAPAVVHAESAQATGTQPPSAAEQAQQGQQSGDSSETLAQQQQPTSEEKGPANETGVVVEGKEGTQSGDAPDQAPTGDQTGLEEAQQQGSQQTGQQTGQQQGSQTGQQTGQQQGSQQTGQQTGQQQGSQQTGQQQGSQQTGQQTGQQGNQQTGQQQTGQGDQQQAGQQSKGGQGQDAVVAKVGDREIRRSDVLTVIGMLPPQLQQQPPEMLIPIALDQLVMRELILEKAKEAGLESDPAVTSLAEDASQRAKEDAMVQVWLERELGEAVTEEKVQQTYESVKQQMGGQAPDVETLRPQIEQELRQQAFVDLSRDLQEGAEITLYGPDGQPVSQ